MEVAASLRQLGLAVTLIHMGSGLFDQLGSAELSEQLLALYREHDVDILLEDEVARFGGGDPLEYVETTSGLCVEADLASVRSSLERAAKRALKGLHLGEYAGVTEVVRPSRKALDFIKQAQKAAQTLQRQ
jgi:hypothetical protein